MNEIKDSVVAGFQWATKEVRCIVLIFFLVLFHSLQKFKDFTRIFMMTLWQAPSSEHEPLLKTCGRYLPLKIIVKKLTILMNFYFFECCVK